jgi:putative ABC transport system permease protein
MLNYYIELAIRSLRRYKLLTALIVLTVGLGIGAGMTMITVLHAMSADPLPNRSAKLYYPHLEPGPKGLGNAMFDVGRDFTWPDANNLLDAKKGVRQAMMAGGRLVVDPENAVLKRFYSPGHYVTTDFFKMFGAPFLSGSGWNTTDDAGYSRIVVLNDGLAEKLFGNASAAVGHSVNLQGKQFRVVGVLRAWHPSPLFYGEVIGSQAYDSKDEFFIPLNTAMALKFPVTGGSACWGSGDFTSDECTWLQFWVELDTPQQVATYKVFLKNYWEIQKSHGRFPQDVSPELYGFVQRLHAMRLVPSELRLQLWLALGFLAVCQFNAMCLILAKFLRRGSEVSVRRAMGAAPIDIFSQLATESGILGLVGGGVGLLFTWLGVWLVRQRPEAYAQLAHLDLSMVLETFALAILSSVLAGILPAWRGCKVNPALQLKLQ